MTWRGTLLSIFCNEDVVLSQTPTKLIAFRSRWDAGVVLILIVRGFPITNFQFVHNVHVYRTMYHTYASKNGKIIDVATTLIHYIQIKSKRVYTTQIHSVLSLFFSFLFFSRLY